MEEILASIRRIIADDEVAGPNAANAPKDESPPDTAPMPAAEPEVADLPPVALVHELEPAVMPSPAAQASDILELTEDMRTSEPPHQLRTIPSESDIMFADPEPEPEPEAEPAPEPEPQPAPAARAFAAPDPLQGMYRAPEEAAERPLLSSSASAAVDSAFASLAHTVLTHNARTLDDLVKDMLRPMLKAWLDDNLPGLVERLVRAEIERVSRGR